MKYVVIFEDFTKNHYIRSLAKKYKTAWDKTLLSLMIEFSKPDLLFEKGIAKVIIHSDEIKICKSEFKILGTNVSRHASGLRCIFAVYDQTKEVKVLLVYAKTDLGGSKHETAKWKQKIKDNYELTI